MIPGLKQFRLSALLCASNVLYFCLLTTIPSSHALVVLPPAAVVHTACGFVAGSAGAVAAYPIDYVKSQLQTEDGRAKYSGGLEAAMEIVREDGILALYRGVMVNVVGIAPEKTIKLSVNDAARLAITSQLGYLPMVGEMIAGGFAGMTQVIVTNPLEVVKVKMQTSEMSVQDVLSQLKSIGDYYQGAGACVVRDMTFSAILFPLYAHAKVAIATTLVSIMASMDGDTGAAAATATAGTVAAVSISFWSNMLAGSLAAAPAAILATPADVVKTRMQQANRRQTLAFEDPLVTKQESSTSSTSPMEVVQILIAEEGAGVLFSGCLERVVRSVPQFGVTLAVFDVLNTIAIEHGWIVSSSS